MADQQKSYLVKCANRDCGRKFRYYANKPRHCPGCGGHAAYYKGRACMVFWTSDGGPK